jgi:hypothetical protein
MQQFSDHPRHPGIRVWTRSVWGAVGSALTLLLIVTLVVVMLAAAGSMFPALAASGVKEAVLATLFLAALLSAMTAVGLLVWRDLGGKLGASIVLGADGIELKLPAGRSLTNKVPRVDAFVAYANIVALETRDEAYETMGVSNVQRTYRLVRRDDEPIFLFEQRGLRTRVETASMQDVAEEMAARAGVALRNKGMVRCRGGVLGAWFVQPADWSARAMSSAERTVQWNRVAALTTGLTVAIITTWVVSLMVLAP